jgi:hypothetical protein
MRQKTRTCNQPLSSVWWIPYLPCHLAIPSIPQIVVVVAWSRLAKGNSIGVVKQESCPVQSEFMSVKAVVLTQAKAINLALFDWGYSNWSTWSATTVDCTTVIEVEMKQNVHVHFACTEHKKQRFIFPSSQHFMHCGGDIAWLCKVRPPSRRRNLHC